MRTILTLVGLIAFGAQAVPQAAAACLDDAHAQRVANNFATLISAYTDSFANQTLTTDFTDYSDSVDTLINSGCPDGPAVLGTATFSSRAQFEAGQGGQPNITFNIENVWHNCDTVTLRWYTPAPNPDNTTAPAVQTRVQGIIVLVTTFQSFDCPQPFLINTVYSEFNSGSWLYDLGVFKPNCTSSSSKVRRQLMG